MSEIKIGTGIATFRKIRKDGYYYIDKTDFISEFLTSSIPEVSLITRPRRFGKSLTMSMLADFFDNQKDSTDIFAGLKITEDKALCKQWMNNWPVIYLRFKRIEEPTFADSLRQISRIISFAVRQHPYVFQSDVLDADQKNELSELKKELKTENCLNHPWSCLVLRFILYIKKR